MNRVVCQSIQSMALPSPKEASRGQPIQPKVLVMGRQRRAAPSTSLCFSGTPGSRSREVKAGAESY